MAKKKVTQKKTPQKRKTEPKKLVSSAARVVHVDHPPLPEATKINFPEGRNRRKNYVIVAILLFIILLVYGVTVVKLSG